MNKRKLVVEVEKDLMSLSTQTFFEGKRPDPLIAIGYAMARKNIGAAELPLREIGMYEKVVAGVDQADAWRKGARYDEASDLLFDLFQELILKSGTSEQMGRRYGKRPDGGAPRMPAAGELIHGCGEPGPDAYGGHFIAMASEQDQAAVSTVATGLAVLRAELMIAWAGTGADVPGKFHVLKQHAAKAERPLEALGLYRLLLDTLAAAESFAGEGEPMEADELLADFERHLKARTGPKPAKN